jgi:hypothetical protein
MALLWIQKMKRWNRERKVLKTCGCACYCPHCKDILNDNSKWSDLDDYGHGFYLCANCKKKSFWHFGAAPVPILLPEPTIQQHELFI